MRSHKEIAEELLGYVIDDEGFAPCPGATAHSTQSAGRDWRIWFEGDGKPHEHCFHSSCKDARDDFMRRLYRAIAAEEKGMRVTKKVMPKAQRPLPASPKPRKVKAAPLDVALVRELAARVEEEITPEWLRRRSPVAIPQQATSWAELMLDSLYKKGSKILVFTSYRSQGQYLYVAGDGPYKLGNKPTIKAVRSARLPNGGNEGVWYLTSPVKGTWEPNPSKRDRGGNLIAGRRHAACCTSFPYLVIESDTIEPGIWLKILVQLADPIVAIYTSGGKSVHALVRVAADTQEEFNVCRDEYIERLSAVGADAAAITPVRLSRLPGCLRHGTTDASGTYVKYDEPHRQELLYLNPYAKQGSAIINQVEQRGSK